MEKNTIQSDVIRGNINTIILKALSKGERYGYDIIKEINDTTSGQYFLKQPTLYSCLTRLESQGFIESYWGSKSNGGRRKYYNLTDLGREVFLKSQSEWEFSRTVIDRLISDKTVDLDALSKPEIELPDEEKEEADSAVVADTVNMPESASNIEVTDKETELIKKEVQAVHEDTNFIDTAEVMTQLFRKQMTQLGEPSYTEKLVSEKYVADRTVKSEQSADYFKDFYDESSETPYEDNKFNLQEIKPTDQEAEPTYQTAKSTYQEAKSTYQTTKQTYQEETYQKSTPTYFEEIGTAISDTFYDEIPLEVEEKKQDSGKILDFAKKGQDESVTSAEKENFYNYNAKVISESAATTLLEREYKNILGAFANASFAGVAKGFSSYNINNSTEKTEIAEKTSQKSKISGVDGDGDMNLDVEPAMILTKDADVNKKLNKLANDMRGMGDNLKIRTHSNDTGKEYSNMFYYYSNKLMLVHYAIMFGIMLIEILLTSVLIFVGLKINRTGDLYYYVGAVILALLFPTVAFVKNSMQPNKRKRINFNLKSSLVYRIIVTAQLLLIIYCFNLLIQMPLTFSMDYLNTLVLPAVLATNFIVSALIFNGLFKSKKYAVEE